MANASTIDTGEVDKFSAMAAEWWDPFGEFAPLHRMNPVRLSLIRDRLCEHFGRDRHDRRCLEGLRLLDIGCGGGLVSEPMARLGAEVVGIDAAAENVKTAAAHAAETGVDVEYRAITVEKLLAGGEAPFDVVLSLEVVEHVADVDLFLKAAAGLLKPDGMMGVATINRTLRAVATAKVAAEYVLRWVPAGTHDPRKFVRPQEIRKPLERAGLRIASAHGLTYQPLLASWRVTEDLGVNYMLFATRR